MCVCVIFKDIGFSKRLESRQNCVESSILQLKIINFLVFQVRCYI